MNHPLLVWRGRFKVWFYMLSPDVREAMDESGSNLESPTCREREYPVGDFRGSKTRHVLKFV